MSEPSVPSALSLWRASFLKSLARIASATTVFVGSLVLVGWGLDKAVLKSVFPGAVTMKANTALAFVLAGMSLWLLGTDQASLRRRRIAVVYAALVTLIGSLTVAEYLFGWNLGIDQLLFQESSDAAGTSHPGRMAPTTALNFILIGAALALLDAARGFRVVQFLVVLVGFIGLFGGIGYLYRIKTFYGIASYTEMALPTAVAFVVLCVSILCARPDRGLMAIVASDTAGGIMARRMLPFAIGVPLALGWAGLTAKRAGFISVEFGVALFSASLVVLFVSLPMWIAGLLHRIDMEHSHAEVKIRKHEQEQQIILEQRVDERTAEIRLIIEKLKREIVERKQAQETLRESEERFRLIMENANDTIIYLDLAGIVQWANHQTVVISGRSMEEMIGQSFMTILAPEAVARAESRLTAIRQGKSVAPLVEFEILRPDGRAVWVEANFTSVLRDGTVAGRLLVAREITERKQAEKKLSQLASIVESSNDAVIGKSLDSIILSWNKGAERLFGYTAQEAVGQPITLLIPSDRVIEEARIMERIKQGKSVEHFETVGRRKDGTTVDISLTISPIRDKTGEIVGISKVARGISERKRVETALLQSESQLRQLFEDRERISRDLHDNIIQMLYAIGMGLEECRRLIEKDSEPACEIIDNATAGLNAVIRDVRKYIEGLEPQILNGQQLSAELAKLIRTMEDPNLIRFSLNVDPTAAARLNPGEANHVLYIVREAMSNSLRHSHAKTGIISLRLLKGNVRLEVVDNGVGFDVHSDGIRGKGVHNMMARAKEIGTKLDIVSKPGQGTLIGLNIPKEKKHVSA